MCRTEGQAARWELKAGTEDRLIDGNWPSTGCDGFTVPLNDGVLLLVKAKAGHRFDGLRVSFRLFPAPAAL